MVRAVDVNVDALLEKGQAVVRTACRVPLVAGRRHIHFFSG
jgi:hypothetical protein